MKVTTFVGSVIVLTLSLSSSAKEINQNVPVGEHESIEIIAKQGEFSVLGWAKDFVQLSGHADKDALVERENSKLILNIPSDSTSEEPDKLEIKIPSDRRLSVTSNNADFSFDGLNPRLAKAAGSNDDDASKSTSDISVSSVDGVVVVKNSSGSFNINTINGDIKIIDSKGTANIRSFSGQQDINGDFRNVNSSNVSGQSTYKLRTLEKLNLSNVNGDSLIESAVSRGANVQIQSVKGNVELLVPETTSARFSLNSHQGGRIENSLVGELDIDNSSDDSQILTLADASASITIDTMSGGIVVAPQNSTDTGVSSEDYDWSSVDTSVLDFAFVNPNYNILDYQEIFVKKPEIQFDSSWVRKHGVAISQDDRQRIADEYAEMFRQTIADRFSRNKRFKIVDERTENVLVIIPKVLELYIDNPDMVTLKDVLVATPAGNARLDLVIFSPSDQAILALFMDKRSTRKPQGIATSKTRALNSRAFSRLFKDWVKDISTALAK